MIALLAQAILEARRHAERRQISPLAVVHTRQASEALQRKMAQFREEYAPDVAIGLVSDVGDSRFFGPDLEGLNIESPVSLVQDKWAQPRKATDLLFRPQSVDAEGFTCIRLAGGDAQRTSSGVSIRGGPRGGSASFGHECISLYAAPSGRRIPRGIRTFDASCGVAPFETGHGV